MTPMIDATVGWIIIGIAGTAAIASFAWGFLGGRVKPRLAVDLVPNPGRLGGYEIVAALKVKNIGNADIRDSGLAKIERIDRQKLPAGLPFNLRTLNQIKEDRNRPWNLRQGGDPKTIPVVYRNPKRPTDWYLIDAQGQKHYLPARSTKFVIGVYALETSPQRVLLTLTVGDDGSVNDGFLQLSRGVA